MPNSLRNTLIRAHTMDMRRNHGNVVVAEILFRRVSFHPPGMPGAAHDVPGAVLIDAGAALAPIARAVGLRIGHLVMIRATDELLWIPVRADMSVGDYWTIDMVPWVEYLRASTDTDDNVLRRAHQ